MLEYYNMIRRENISIIYSGPIGENGIEGIAATIKNRLEYDDLPLTASQSVFSVFVEQMTNMLMYSAEKETLSKQNHEIQEVSKGIFILGAQDKTYFVQSGNMIKKENVDILIKKIDYLNTLNKDGIRKYYREQLRGQNTNPESKGAGLGLIEIARRSSSKIEYTVTPTDGGMLFFSMFVTIG